MLRGIFGALQAISTRLAAKAALALYLFPTHRLTDRVDQPMLAQAQVSQLPVPGGHVRVLSWGSGARTVLLMHGWGSHAPRWSNLAALLVAQGWRVLAFDAPGHGRSSGHRSSLTDFITTLDRVIDSHGPVTALVAHSMGALAAVRVLASRTEPPMAAAVLISLPHDLGYLTESYEQALALRAPTVTALRARYTQRFGQAPKQADASVDLPHVGCPVLLVHDLQDDIVPIDHAQQLLPLLKQGALHTTQGLGHSGLLRDPATLGAIAGFLQGTCGERIAAQAH